jgi:hypothetical protein
MSLLKRLISFIFENMFKENDPISSNASSGYSLQQDGKYYRYYSQRTTASQSARSCWADHASLPSPYPPQAMAIIRNMTNSSNWLVLGAYRPDYNYSGLASVWLTYDGTQAYGTSQCLIEYCYAYMIAGLIVDTEPYQGCRLASSETWYDVQRGMVVIWAQY